MKKLAANFPLYKEILSMAWPTIIEQLLVMMVGTVSTVFVGRLGTAELAAVGLINMVVFFLQTIFTGLATGATVVIARVSGEGDYQKAKNALVQSLFIGIFAGLVITIPGYVFATPMLSLFMSGAEARVLEIGLIYYKIIMLAMPFLVIDLVVAGAVRGSGDTKTPMYVTIVVNIINIILSSLLIFGVTIGGRPLIPAFGIVGAGLSVMIARMSGGIIRIIVVFVNNGPLRLSLQDFKVNPGMMGRIVRVGLPAFMEQFIMQGGFLVIQLMIISYGTVQSAAYQIGVNVNSFAFMPIFGFAIAATAMVGQRLGAKDLEMAEKYAKASLQIAVGVISIIGLITLILASQLTWLYTTDSAVMGISIMIIRLFSLTDPFIGVMNVCAGVLRAAGDVMYVMITALIGLWLFRVVITYLLHRFFGLGIYGAMAGIVADFSVRSGLYYLRVRAGRWKLLKV